MKGKILINYGLDIKNEKQAENKFGYLYMSIGRVTKINE